MVTINFRNLQSPLVNLFAMGNDITCETCGKKDLKDGNYVKKEWTEWRETSFWEKIPDHEFDFSPVEPYQEVHRRAYYCWNCIQKEKQKEEHRMMEEQKRQEQEKQEEERRRMEEQNRQEQLKWEEKLKEREENRRLVVNKRDQRLKELQRLLLEQEELEAEEMQDNKSITVETQALFKELRMQEYKLMQAEQKVERNLTTINSRCSLLEYTKWKNIRKQLLACSQFSVKERNEESSECSLQSTTDQYIITEMPLYEGVLCRVMDVEISGNLKDHQWLLAMQSYLLFCLCRHFNLSDAQADILLDALSHIAINLSVQECAKLTKALASFCIESDVLNKNFTKSFEKNMLQSFLKGLIHGCRDLGFYSGTCAIRCHRNYLNLCEEGVHYDKEVLEMMAVNPDASLWCVFCNVDRAVYGVDQPGSVDLQLLKRKLDIIHKYNVPYYAHDKDLKDLLQFKFRPEKKWKSIMQEIFKLNDFNGLREFLRKIESYVNQLGEIEMCQEICDKCLKYDRKNTIEALKRIQESSDPAVADVVLVLRTLSYAFYKFKKYKFMPRKTQLLAVCILLLSQGHQLKLLLEVLTGEGKSSIIAMFAAALAMTGKKVDIITSSPVLARRDAKIWIEFFKVFDLCVDHNTETQELLQMSQSEASRRRSECYRSSIVYGTVSSFSADFLREKFGMKDIRSHRGSAVAIVDEVDMLMLDEGVQFTYLSHATAVLRHIEPVLAMVWSAVGQNTPICTINGDVLFAGVPKGFHNIIYDSTEKREDTFEHPKEILQFLLDECVANSKHREALTKLLESQNAESEKLALAMLNSEDLGMFIKKLNEAFPFQVEAYIYTEQNYLEICIKQDGVENPTSVLLADKGVLYPLYSQEELSQGIKAMISSQYNLPNQVVPTDNQQLVHIDSETELLCGVPCPFDDFITDHLDVAKVLKLSLKGFSEPKQNALIQFLDSKEDELRCKLMEKFTDIDLLNVLQYMEEHSSCTFPEYYTLNHQQQLVRQSTNEKDSSNNLVQGILVLDKGMLCPLFDVTVATDPIADESQQDCCRMIMEMLCSPFRTMSSQPEQLQSQDHWRKHLYSRDGRMFVCGVADYFDNTISRCVDCKQLLSLLKITENDGQEISKIINGAKKNQHMLVATDLLPIIDSSERCLSYNFEVYTQNDQKELVREDTLASVREIKSSPTIPILLTDKGMICKLHPKEIIQLPCSLKSFVANQLPTYIDSAFTALNMTENREYILKGGKEIIPVDFQNSGVIEENKRWGGGLQQMLEMKHHLQISPMSIVTNFMSHVEFFRQYTRNGALYGLSGTIGGSFDAEVLEKLYNLQVCKVPTHQQSLRCEKDVIFVQGEREEWLEKIHAIVKDATKPKSYISEDNGTAVLILCEDIRTAKEIQSYVGGKLPRKPKLYDGDVSISIEKDALVPGDVIIATNLAGRGTDISVADEVNNSGGLLCLMTFVPRNRRVELQAFGRTARNGSPGSVQYVLQVSELPCKYRDGLDIATLHEVLESKEHERLQQILENDIKAIELREELFQKHCHFLKGIHCDREIETRKDKQVIIDTINENWGQWLQLKQAEIEAVSPVQNQYKLITELEDAQCSWRPPPNMSPEHLPESNYYHLVKFGNQQLENEHISDEKNRAREASKYFDKAIDQEPNFTMIAHYNRAYCSLLIQDSEGYISSGIQDLQMAREQLKVFYDEITLTLQCAMVSRHKCPQYSENNNLLKQMEVRMQVLKYFEDRIDETITKINEFKTRDDDFEVVSSSILEFIPRQIYISDVEICEELYSLYQLGLEFAFKVQKKPRFCWEGLAVFTLGLLQIVAGICISMFTAGALSSFGMGLISEGVSDCIDGVVGMVTGEFDWKAWGISKACSIGVSIACGAVSKFISKGTKAIRGVKKASSLTKKANTIFKDLKGMSTVAKGSWGTAMKIQAKNVAKLVGKELLIQGIMYAVGEIENKVIHWVFKEIGEGVAKRMKRSLEHSFQTSTSTEKELGLIVDCKFVSELSDCFVREDKMDPVLNKRAKQYFASAAEYVVEKYGQHSHFDSVAEHIRSLLPKISNHLKLKGKAKLVAAAVCELSELAFVVDSIKKAIDGILDLTDSFLPDLKIYCYEYESFDETQMDTSRYSLACVTQLKAELAQHSAKMLGEAVTSLLVHNLTWIVNRGLSMTINKYATEKLHQGLHVAETKKLIRAGQNANYLRSMALPTAWSDNIDFAAVKCHSDKVLDPTIPGTLAELRVAAETFGCRVVIEDKDGNRVCSLASQCKQEKPKIVLVHTPPDQYHPLGHYQVKIDGRTIDVSSSNNSCMYEAFAHGLSEAKRGDIPQLPITGDVVRKRVSKEIQSNPHQWHEHLTRKEELLSMKHGMFFLHLGGKKSKG